MKKIITRKELLNLLDLWNKALDVCMSKDIPEEILDDHTRMRLTGFLCEKSLEAGRVHRKNGSVSISFAKKGKETAIC